MKKFLLAVPVALAIGTVAIPAYAGTSVGIAIGEPYPGYEPYPRYHPYPAPDYPDYYEDDEQDQISCREGRQIVRDMAFRQVRPVKCEGSVYRYRAIKRGRAWLVRVDSYSARIVSARPMRDY